MPAVTVRDLLFPGLATDFFGRQPFPDFDISLTGFQPVHALWLAELSRLVYRHDSEENNPPPSPTRRKYLEDAGFRQAGFFKAGDDTQAMLVVRGTPPELAVLAFRGTETLRDWIKNINLPLVPFAGGGRVHSGFLRGLDAVWPEIERALNGMSCPVYFTGHSLGAALATIAAARHQPRALYTFGSPQLGDAVFAGVVRCPTYRIVHSTDAVTAVPGEALEYRHVGTRIHITGPGPGLFTKMLSLVRGVPDLLDHAPAYYVDRVGSAKPVPLPTP
jgi:triacylglycerol lipase